MSRQRGFSLVAAIFMLVVLASLAAFAIRIGASQQHTVDLALLGARTLSAANAGIEWGAKRALSGSCSASPINFVLNEGALNGYRIEVTCTQTTHAEGVGAGVQIYVIDSFAQTGIYGQPDYVSRRVRARFTGA